MSSSNNRLRHPIILHGRRKETATALILGRNKKHNARMAKRKKS